MPGDELSACLVLGPSNAKRFIRRELVGSFRQCRVVSYQIYRFRTTALCCVILTLMLLPDAFFVRNGYPKRSSLHLSVVWRLSPHGFVPHRMSNKREGICPVSEQIEKVLG